jgi:Domain of unknown function (DUF397)
MNLRRLKPTRRSINTNDSYYQLRGVRAEDITRATWLKSSISTYNGSCCEIARLLEDRVGVRDTKDKGSGPVLIFSQSEWDAFLSGAKAGEFDSV